MKKILVLVIFMFIVSGCNNTTNYKNSFLAFDTYIEFSAYAKDEEEFTKYFNYTKDEFNRYHHLFDAYKNYKGLNNVKTINDNAGKKAVKVDKDLFNLIKKSKEYYKGAYQRNNIALAPVVLEYKRVQEKYDNNISIKPPKMNILLKKSKCSNMKDIVLDEAKSSVFLKKECNLIDVGAVAKGFATDAISEKLKKQGVASALINAGGNVSIIGKKPKDELFKIGITDPNNIDNYVLILSSSDNNVVTSGDYQRYFKYNGKRFHHIIDPSTLLPSTPNKSVTIVSDDGLKADFFSTESFMLDVKKIDNLSKKFDFEYIVIDKNDKITISEGIKDEVKAK